MAQLKIMTFSITAENRKVALISFGIVSAIAMVLAASLDTNSELRYCMPLGPYPLLFGGFSMGGILHIPFAPAMLMFVLWIWFPDVAAKDHLERGVALYVIARIGESVGLWLNLSIGGLLTVLLTGLLFTIPAGLRFYCHNQRANWKIAMAVFTGTLVGYFASLIFVFLLVPGK